MSGICSAKISADVELGSTVELDNIMIRLNMSFNDGRGGMTRYFYGDTLEEAPEFIERDCWEYVVEKAEGCEFNRETMQRHSICLSNAARKAYRQHTDTQLLRSVAAEQCAQAVATPEPDGPELGE